MPDDLYDLAALADRYDWTIGTARAFHGRSNRRRREGTARPFDLPAPDHRFGRSPVWSAETLDEWDRVRPRKSAGA